MSNHLEATAEITKLGRLLDVDADELGFLADVAPAALRTFRTRATDLLFDRDADRLHRVAAASRLVPVAIAAKAAELAFGPLLCAAVAGLVEPDRGVAIAERLPTQFLAQTAIQLDPRRTVPLLGAVPPAVVADVGRELLRLGDYVTMGRFVGVLPEASLRAAAAVMSDADLLRIAFLLEDKSRVDELIDLVEDRLASIVAAAHEHDLWAEGIDMLATVGVENRGRLGDLTASHGDAVLEGIIRAAARLDAWDALLPVTRTMSHDSLLAFCAHPAVHEPQTIASIVGVALDGGLWPDLLPLAAHLPPEPLAHVASTVAEQPDERLAALVLEAVAAGRWDEMIPIALAMHVDDRRRLARLPALHDDDLLQGVLATVARLELWAEAVPLLDALPGPERERVLVLVDGLDDPAPARAALAGLLTG